jgi:hypothetical protein
MKEFTYEKWSNELKSVMNNYAVELSPIVIVMKEQELDNDIILSDLNGLLAHGDWLSMCSIAEKRNIADKL